MTTKKTGTNGNSVKTARTTFEILEMIKERSEVTVTELAEEFDLSQSSIHNYLSTLKEDEYLVKEDNKYRIGLRFLDFGGHARYEEPLYRTAKSEVKGLAEETGELANLATEQHGKGVYLYRARGEHAVLTDSYTGKRVHLHNTALGKAILAHLPRERVDEIIDHHGLPQTTEKTISDREALDEELERIREEGVAFDKEARLKGLRCVAVPILNSDNEVKGAISVSGPTSRFQGERFRAELPEKLKSAANIVELNITYD